MFVVTARTDFMKGVEDVTANTEPRNKSMIQFIEVLNFPKNLILMLPGPMRKDETLEEYAKRCVMIRFDNAVQS